MAQSVKATATKPDTLSSSPGTTGWKERHESLKLSSDPNTHSGGRRTLLKLSLCTMPRAEQKAWPAPVCESAIIDHPFISI